MSIIKVKTGGITADAITDALIADDVVGTEHLTANEVDTTALGADAVTGAQIADDAISEEHLDVTSITGHTAETSIADGDTLLIHDASASALRKITKANFVSGVGESNKPSFHAYSSNGQTPSDATHTKVELDAELYDSDSAFDTSNYRFTVPSGEGGTYFLYGHIAIDSQEASGIVYASAKIRKNNNSDLIETYTNQSANQQRDIPFFVHGAFVLSAGDYVELFGYLDDDSGSGMDFKGASSGRLATNFGGFKLF